MCFSAAASFGAAAFAGLGGVLTLASVSKPGEIPLAATPLVFALQQALEGGLWRAMPGAGPEALLLANGFAVVALVVWPLLAPLSAGLVEPDPARRRLVWWLAALGLGFALYSAADIAAHPYHAVQSFKSLCYINNSPYPQAALPLYCAATCGGFLLSSSAPLRLFGAVALAGLAVSLLTFFTALVSVWCFFAAAASMILVAHFRWRSYDRCAASR